MLDALSILSDNPPKNVTYDKGNCTAGVEEVTTAIYTKQVENTEDPVICIITGISTLLSKLDAVKKGEFTTNINEAARLGTIKFIFVETIDNIKSLNYEAWFKANIDLSEGIWIGNGISNQFTLKVTTNSRLLRAELEPNFGYVVTKGKAAVTKFLSDE